MANLIVAIVSSLVTAAILGVCRLCYEHWNDRVRLTASLNTYSGLDVHQTIGCDCLVLAVTNKGIRVAKISKAILAIGGVDLIPQFEEAFGASFGYVPVEGAPPPYVAIELPAMKKPDCSDGFILERDDVVRFAIPALAPFLILVPKAKSQDVWIAVKYFDDKKEVLIRGLRIQDMVRNVIQMSVGTNQSLKIKMAGSLHASSAAPPSNSAFIGATNSNSLSYLSEGEAKELREKLGIQEVIPDIRVPLYVLVPLEKNEVHIIATDNGYVLPMLGSKEIASEHLENYLIPMRIIELETFAVLRSFVEQLIANAKKDRTTYVLYDSSQAGERVTVAIPVEDFVAAIPH